MDVSSYGETWKIFEVQKEGKFIRIEETQVFVINSQLNITF